MKPNEPVRSESTVSSRSFVGSARFYIYFTYILGAWGDWMWQFAVGLYLVKLGNHELLLAAIFGFLGGSCVLFFGGIIGDWVDRNPRLKVVIVSLVIQNMSVASSATVVGLTMAFGAEIDKHEQGKVIRRCCEVGIIITAISAQLASVAYKIAIEKDWIVVVARGSKSRLANLNAVTRGIDLCFKVLAPMTVGLIMTYVSDLASAIVIAVWNVSSVFLEYGLLHKVYNMVPALAIKGSGPTLAEIGEDDPDDMVLTPIYKGLQVATATDDVEHNNKLNDGSGEAAVVKSDDPDITSPLTNSTPSTSQGVHDHNESQPEKKKSFIKRMFEPLITLVRGWTTYARQKVVFAGLSLAFLYMTVLGFDSITTGYIYANNIPEWGVALAMALAGVTGIIGAYVFTQMRKRVGLERTGLFAFSAEILCLTLCVASIFLPGTMFKHAPQHHQSVCPATQVQDSFTNTTGNRTVHGRVKRSLYDQSALETPLSLSQLSHGQLITLNSYWISSDMYRMHHIAKRDINQTFDTITVGTTVQESDVNTTCEGNESIVSIMFFLVGVVTSRVGLWMADLVVTQLLQENVLEQERGIVNGVQNSLNMLLDMFKFLLVIILPAINTYGYLIILSFGFICVASCFFAFHSWRVRGHLCHCHRCFPCCKPVPTSRVSTDEKNSGKEVNIL